MKANVSLPNLSLLGEILLLTVQCAYLKALPKTLVTIPSLDIAFRLEATIFAFIAKTKGQ